MRSALLSFFFLMIALAGVSQTIDQVDEHGKKHGTWKVYLDKNWKPVKDSTKSSFIKYTHFEHGYDIYGSANYKGLSLSQPAKGKLLDGEYKWIDKKGAIRFIEVYEKGYPVSLCEYEKNGVKRSFADYRTPWRSEPNTYRLSMFHDNKVQYYFMRNGEKGWNFYPGAEDGK
jgi:hypothetical protein